ncbi:MAG TPA: transposase [Flavobacteriaceae bacterium]|nr:transposase [Flavobacteriaceae bacterium]
MCKVEFKNNDNKPYYELQDIFNKYSNKYRLNHKLTSEQKRAITDITSCRTSKLGFNARECSDCKNIEFSYNSCRNRNCPKCQGQKRFQWVQNRLKTTLNVPYYHTVFTVPNQLFDIAIYNQKIFYDLLFKCSSDTLKLFALNTKYWNFKEIEQSSNSKPDIKLSFFGILHTWGQTLVYHPHIHFIVAGAGIIKDEIVEPKYNSKFLFPVKAMSKVFRGKLIQGIKKAYYGNKLELDKRFEIKGFFESFIDNIVNRKWVVYSKSQFQSSAKIVEYMSRYTHRTAISNSRIISIGNNTIRFKYKDYKDRSKIKTMKLSDNEFIKRFLYHIPPKRYFRIRYYGVIQKLSTIKNKKIIIKDNKTSQNKPTKPKCKKCQCETSEIVVILNGVNKVIQGLMTPTILNLKREVKFNDSS